MRYIVWVVVTAALACGKVENTASDGGGADAPAADASTDARQLPTDPPVSDGQSAELVLGQPDFTPGSGGLSNNQFRHAGGLASDGQRLWVADIQAARVVQFNAQPLVNQASADVVIGQASFNEEIPGPDALHLTPPELVLGGVFGDVASDGSIVAVADGHANRVLIWNSVPATSGVNWDVVLGQTTPTGDAAGASAAALNSPRGVFTDGQILLVADTLNHRVLIWTSIPTTDNQAADLVLGQSNFDSAEAPDPPTPASMNEPVDVFYDGERLYVSDSQNNRIMVWNGLPEANNVPADYFVGQASGATGGENAGAGSQGPNAVGLHLPGQIAVAHGNLFILDRVNFRLVVHTPRPEASGEEADAVLGAADLTGTALTDTDQGFTPRGVGVFGDRLFVADSNEASGISRVLRYQLTNLP